MLDWDYEFECPECGAVYGGEVDCDSGRDVKKVTCDECGHVFMVKAKAYVDIDVETEEVDNGK